MSLQFTMHHDLLCDGDLYGTITCNTDYVVTGTLAVTGAATFTSTISCASISFTGAQTFNGGMVVNELGAAVDFRVEGDTLPNLVLVDGSADLVYITDAATGGTAPTAPTGSFTTGTLLAVQNNSAATDNAVVALIAGATSGLSQIDFGDSGDANIGSISYAHASDTFTITAGTDAVMTVAANAVAIDGAVTINDSGAAVDFRVEGDNLPNLVLVDASADLVYVTDAATGGTAPTAPTGGFTTGTLLAVQNNSAATDNAVVALVAGATSGVSGVDFGDADDANIGSVAYDHSTNIMTVTAGANAVMTLASAAIVMNEDGDANDFRVEGDNLPNLLFVDGSADVVFVTDAATGGTPPTAPTGGLTTGTLLCVQNNSAATDNAVLALVAGATSGLSQIDFGDADDANIGSLSYDHSSNTMTLTAGTTGVLAATSSGVAVTGTLSSTGIADLDQIVSGTANMALGNGDNDDVTNPGASVAYITGPTAAFTISGITGGTDGQILIIINNVAQNLTLENENGGSTAANRILTGTGGDVATTAQGACILCYSGTSSRWHLVSGVAA